MIYRLNVVMTGFGFFIDHCQLV